MLVYVHGCVCRTQESVDSPGIFGEKSDTDAGRTVQRVALEDERFVEAALQAACDLLDVGAAAHHGNQRGKFVPSEPSEFVVRAKLPLHAICGFL